MRTELEESNAAAFKPDHNKTFDAFAAFARSNFDHEVNSRAGNVVVWPKGRDHEAVSVILVGRDDQPFAVCIVDHTDNYIDVGVPEVICSTLDEIKAAVRAATVDRL